MRTPILRHAARVLALAILIATACGKDNPASPVPAGFIEPDFSLVDANSNSATSGQTVSPRQYLGRISAWYFGHSS